MNRNSFKTLAVAMDEYKTLFGDIDNAFAILYTPKNCHLLLQDSAGKFFNQVGAFMPQNVFEARIFNSEAELRWLHEFDGMGRMAIITDASFPDRVTEPIRQTYLLWGQSTGETKGNWTQFGTARIGAFWVPLANVPEQGYARFTAVEYLKEYEDGNVSVVDERLTGIERA